MTDEEIEKTVKEAMFDARLSLASMGLTEVTARDVVKVVTVAVEGSRRVGCDKPTLLFAFAKIAEALYMLPSSPPSG